MASRFKVHNRSDGSIEIINGDRVCLVYNIVNDTLNQRNWIHISSIRKCSDSESLTRKAIKMVEHSAISNKDGIKSIHLEDDSTINVCGVPLPLHYLKILTTGQSWYNSIGYKSSEHDADVAHNEEVINKPMNQLLSELSYKGGFPGLPLTLDNLQSFFPGLSLEMKVKDYVTAMSNQLPRSGTTNCTVEQVKKARLLYNLIDAIRGRLNYNIRLHKIVYKSHATGSASRNNSSVMSTIRKMSTIRTPPVKRFKYDRGGAKITIRKSRRKRRTRKYIKRKTA
jgi:hypothetical protein